MQQVDTTFYIIILINYYYYFIIIIKALWFKKVEECIKNRNCYSSIVLDQLSNILEQLTHINPDLYWPTHWGLNDTPCDILYPYLLPIYQSNLAFILQTIRDPSEWWNTRYPSTIIIIIVHILIIIHILIIDIEY